MNAKLYDICLLERYTATFGLTLEKEYKFVPNRRFRADFAILEWRLLLEINGGCWNAKSRHFYGAGAIKDMEKYNLAAIHGYQILHFTPKQFCKTQGLNILECWRKQRSK